MSITNPSSQQQAIFNWFREGKGNLIVRARAGTGKTTTIIEGIDHAPERKILLAAFNKKIAVELSDRLNNPAAEAKTLHALGFGYVLRNWNGTQVDDQRGVRLARMAVTDDVPDDIVRLIARLASRCKNTCPTPSVEDVISEAEDANMEPDEMYEENGYDKRFIAGRVLEAMRLACKERDGTIDYDDMVFMPVRNGWVMGKYDLVVIDESQDLSMTQLAFAQRLCTKNGRIVVVGDDRQAIYGFRGADSRSMERLKRELNATELGLTITYRCPKKVVELAKCIVSDYEAAPDAPEGTVERMSRQTMISSALPGDFILSRKNAPLAGACLSLLRAGKRAKVEGKDIGKTLITLVNSFNARTVPQFLTRLRSWKQKEFARAQKLDESKRSVRVELIADQAEALEVLVEGLSGMKELRARINDLFSDTLEQGGQGHIICSSVHKAKGRERDNVFLLESTFTSKNIEESNIRYVAITRAKKRLVWVHDA